MQLQNPNYFRLFIIVSSPLQPKLPGLLFHDLIRQNFLFTVNQAN